LEPPEPRLLDDGLAVEVMLEGAPRRFHAVWLRDNAQDPATRSPSNCQRLITLLDIPAHTRLAAAAWREGALRLRFEPEGKTVDFDPAWLAAHAYDRSEPAPPPGWTDPQVIRWDAATAADLPVEDFAAVRDDPAARRRWLAAVRRYGFARLRGAPTEPGVACATAALFGYVRETNYGRAFDVRAQLDARNLADTHLGLQAHTDNPYRDPAPGLQILACLANSAEGGESLVVDGFSAAARLQAEDPDGFGRLAGHCARFEYAGQPGVRLRAKRPILELGADGELIAVRFNSRSAAPLADVPYGEMAAYYAACRRFAELIEDPGLAFRFRLAPGELFIVDNLRVLHARTAFTSGGERWLEGCYADRDGLLSTLAVLEEQANA
jgi:gamma-butyrobetaine hydroxylase